MLEPFRFACCSIMNTRAVATGFALGVESGQMEVGVETKRYRNHWRRKGRTLFPLFAVVSVSKRTDDCPGMS